MTEDQKKETAVDEGGKDQFKAPASQEEFDRMVGARLERERAKFADYDDLKAKASKYDEADEANKTELQKALERADAAEKKLTPAEIKATRLEVALEKRLTATQAKRLVGSTKEELEADADELLADLGAPKKDDRKADPKNLRSGSSGSSEQMTGKEKAAAALRQMRTGT